MLNFLFLESVVGHVELCVVKDGNFTNLMVFTFFLV